MVLNSPCFIVKSWLFQDQTVPVQKQTAFGKDKSNPLIVDSLLKTISFSIHLVVYNEELAIPKQTATGKRISNPLMAVCVDLSILATTLNRVGRSILNWDLQEDVLIRASGLKKIPYEVMTELIVNAQNKSSISITSNDINIELSNEFLVELHKNAYQGWIDEDMMDHIAKVLVMIDLIYIPSVDSHQLQMIEFPLSLADDAQ
ncbi:hypothetical protein Tco_0553536 [Tanacetum coccineum]